jgi:hypothetical protein
MSVWIKSSQVSVTTGATTVTVSDGVSMESVISGDALMIAGQLPARCLSGTAPAAGVATITLAAPWDGPNITNAKAVVMPSAALLRQVATEVAQQNASYSSWWSVMEDWQYAMGTVTVDGPAGPREIPTYPQLAADTEGALSGLGTAASANVTISNTDTTAGRLLKVGDWGIGDVAINVADLAADTSVNRARFFRAIASAVGGTGSVTAGYVSMPIDGLPSTSMLAVGKGTSSPRGFIGTKLGATATPTWAELYTTGNVDGSPWVAPTLLNGWVGIGGRPTRYTKRAGIVSVQGTISGGATAASTVLFVLPVGYRPFFDIAFNVHNGAGKVAQLFILAATGGVYIDTIVNNAQLYTVFTFAAGN